MTTNNEVRPRIEGGMLIYPYTEFKIPVGLYKYARRQGCMITVRHGTSSTLRFVDGDELLASYTEEHFMAVLEPLLTCDAQELPRIKVNLLIDSDRLKGAVPARNLIIDWRLSS